MKNLIILIILSIFVSCEDNTRNIQCYTCNYNQRYKVAQSLEKNIKDANNMSDEEMEDVIAQLERTYVRLYCNQITVALKNNELPINNDTLSYFYY